MDDKLSECLADWSAQIQTLKIAELAYFELEASEKSYCAKLFLSAEGKTVAEREAKAYASDEMINFQKGLAQAKTRYLFEKRNLELYQAVHQSEYLSFKVEHDFIKHPRT